MPGCTNLALPSTVSQFQVAPSTTEKIEPYGSKLLPKRTPITFQPQPIDKPKTAAPPVHVAPKTQPKLNQSQVLPGIRLIRLHAVSLTIFSPTFSYSLAKVRALQVRIVWSAISG